MSSSLAILINKIYFLAKLFYYSYEAKLNKSRLLIHLNLRFKSFIDLA